MKFFYNVSLCIIYLSAKIFILSIPAALFFLSPLWDSLTNNIAQKLKFSIKDWFGHIYWKSLMENFIFCAV